MGITKMTPSRKNARDSVIENASDSSLAWKNTNNQAGQSPFNDDGFSRHKLNRGQCGSCIYHRSMAFTLSCFFLYNNDKSLKHRVGFISLWFDANIGGVMFTKLLQFFFHK